MAAEDSPVPEGCGTARDGGVPYRGGVPVTGPPAGTRAGTAPEDPGEAAALDALAASFDADGRLAPEAIEGRFDAEAVAAMREDQEAVA